MHAFGVTCDAQSLLGWNWTPVKGWRAFDLSGHYVASSSNLMDRKHEDVSPSGHLQDCWRPQIVGLWLLTSLFLPRKGICDLLFRLCYRSRALHGLPQPARLPSGCKFHERFRCFQGISKEFPSALMTLDFILQMDIWDSPISRLDGYLLDVS